MAGTHTEEEEDTGDQSPSPIERPAQAVARHFVSLLRDNVTGDIFVRRGLRHRAIAIRLVVFTLLLDPPPQEWTLASVAERLGVSRSYLSKIGLRFADDLGMRASWMRFRARDTYSVSAIRAHAERRTKLSNATRVGSRLASQ